MSIGRKSHDPSAALCGTLRGGLVCGQQCSVNNLVSLDLDQLEDIFFQGQSLALRER